MNRIQELFKKKKKILNIYYTAGFPELNDTLIIAKALQDAGVDMLEIGIPFSDPLADGPIIQKSSEKALANGMSLQLLFDQLNKLRTGISIPVLLMSYLNPVLQIGMKTFLQNCQQVGIDGLILPDLPILEYISDYKELFQKYKQNAIFFITPATNSDRRKQIDVASSGFLYVVSSASTTGTKKNHWQQQENYFQSIQKAGFKNPTLIGFNIKDHNSFARANQYANGAIIGSAFIQALEQQSSVNFSQIAMKFVKKIRGEN